MFLVKFLQNSKLKKSNTLLFLGLIHGCGFSFSFCCWWCFFFFLPLVTIFFSNQKSEHVWWQHGDSEFDSDAAPENLGNLNLNAWITLIVFQFSWIFQWPSPFSPIVALMSYWTYLIIYFGHLRESCLCSV